MKKVLLGAVMTVLMFCFAACGGSDSGHSKAFNGAKKVIDKVAKNVEKAKTCDDVEMAAFGLLGMLGVEGIDAISEAEQEELNKYSDALTESMQKKKAELGCKDDDFFGVGDEDDSAFDEPVEEEE